MKSAEYEKDFASVLIPIHFPQYKELKMCFVAVAQDQLPLSTRLMFKHVNDEEATAVKTSLEQKLFQPRIEFFPKTKRSMLYLRPSDHPFCVDAKNVCGYLFLDTRTNKKKLLLVDHVEVQIDRSTYDADVAVVAKNGKRVEITHCEDFSRTLKEVLSSLAGAC
jgi:hypothetical protein